MGGGGVVADGGVPVTADGGEGWLMTLWRVMMVKA